MVRFFVEGSAIRDNAVNLSPDDAAHVRSLRLRPSEMFVVCDGEGNDYICRLGEKSGAAVAEIIEKRPSLGEPAIQCTAYIALAKGDRLEYAVQKTVELGVSNVVLFPCARCVAIATDIKKKINRLQKIALETAKQSGRGKVPEISSAESFEAAIRQAGRADIPLFFYECEKQQTLKAALTRFANESAGSISIVTGPEGGFDPSEAGSAEENGLISVSLGPRILRCETAPAAALAAIMFYFGEF